MIEDEPTPDPKPIPTPLLETAQESQHQFSPMDIVEDPGSEPTRHWSSLNIPADGDLYSDSLGADDLPVADLTAPLQTNQTPYDGNATREYGRTTYDTPVIGPTEQQYLDNEENINSTPSKMPSPTRDRRSSSVRSARETGVISSPRRYPSPTPTSSLDGEENQTQEEQEHQRRDNDASQPITDPTDDHEEFDSIMESEGFTMVSLDTLPSAKQYGLGTNASRATDNAAKVLQDRDNGRIGERLKRKLPGISDLQSDSHSSARSSPAINGFSPGSRFLAYANQESKRPVKQSSTQSVSYPDLPRVSPQEKQQSRFEEKDEETAHNPFDNKTVASDDIEDNGGTEEEGELEEVHVVPHSSQLEQEQSPPNDPSNELRWQREAEWHEERQAVSRSAQHAADSDHMIYIDSDQNSQGGEGEGLEGEDAFSDHLQSDFGSINEHERIQPEDFEEQYQREDLEDFEQVEEDALPRPVAPAHVNQSEPGTSVYSPSATKRTFYSEPEVSDAEDDDYDDIWRQEPEYPKHEMRHAPESKPTAVYEPEEPKEPDEEEEDDEEDAFDDIWQQEARDNSYLSQHSETHAQQPAEDAASPWRQLSGDQSNRTRFSSSPDYVDLEKEDIRHLNPTQIRKLREQEVDLSALLAADDTPNRARYYSGTSTPRSILRPTTQSSSLNGSATKSQSARNPAKRVRLQPLSQSPERQPEAEQESPIFRHNHPTQESYRDHMGEADNISDDLSDEAEPEPGDVTTTPELQRQSDVEPQGSSWFQRITSLTPRWLKAPAHADDDDSSSASQEDPGDVSEGELEYGQTDQGELSIQSPPESQYYHGHAPSFNRSSESPIGTEEAPASKDLPQVHDEASSSVQELSELEDQGEDEEDRSQREDSDKILEHDTANPSEETRNSPKGPRPLAVFGYFSNDHYLALRRVYRIAKRHPERFPYYDAPGRAQIIGDWIWTSDGLHGVPISEAQFAIIDRFVNELSHADVQYGGSGQVEWTDADLHRRLISIIIGEQIREERKAQANRGASVDTWR